MSVMSSPRMSSPRITPHPNPRAVVCTPTDDQALSCSMGKHERSCPDVCKLCRRRQRALVHVQAARRRRLGLPARADLPEVVPQLPAHSARADADPRVLHPPASVTLRRPCAVLCVDDRFSPRGSAPAASCASGARPLRPWSADPVCCTHPQPLVSPFAGLPVMIGPAVRRRRLRWCR